MWSLFIVRIRSLKSVCYRIYELIKVAQLLFGHPHPRCETWKGRCYQVRCVVVTQKQKSWHAFDDDDFDVNARLCVIQLRTVHNFITMDRPSVNKKKKNGETNTTYNKQRRMINLMMMFVPRLTRQRWLTLASSGYIECSALYYRTFTFALIMRTKVYQDMSWATLNCHV